MFRSVNNILVGWLICLVNHLFKMLYYLFISKLIRFFFERKFLLLMCVYVCVGVGVCIFFMNKFKVTRYLKKKELLNFY